MSANLNGQSDLKGTFLCFWPFTRPKDVTESFRYITELIAPNITAYKIHFFSTALGHAAVEENELLKNLVSSRSHDFCEVKERMLSTSSNSTCDSQASNEDGSNTPVAQSDDEDEQEDHSLQTGTPTARDATIDESALSS